MLQVGLRLKSIRNDMEVSQADMARKLGMKSQQLNAIENGKAPVPWRKLKEFLKYYKLTKQAFKVILLSEYSKKIDEHL